MVPRPAAKAFMLTGFDQQPRCQATNRLFAAMQWIRGPKTQTFQAVSRLKYPLGVGIDLLLILRRNSLSLCLNFSCQKTPATTLRVHCVFSQRRIYEKKEFKEKKKKKKTDR